MRSARSSIAVAATVVVLLAGFAGLAVASLRQKSVTVDELTYVAAGHYHLRTGRFDLNPTNPPLLKLVAGLPLLGLGLELPEPDGDPAAWDEIRTWHWARAFLYDNTVDADRILLRARLPFVGLGVLLGLYVFHWARRLYGTRGALLSIFVYALSPNVLAHTRLATLDLGLALFLFAGAYHFWDHLRTARVSSLVLSGAAFAAALLAKTTALFLVPAVVASGAAIGLLAPGATAFSRLPWAPPEAGPVPLGRRLRNAVVTGAALVAVTVAGLNLGYLFEGTFQPLLDADGRARLHARLPGEDGLAHEAVDLAGRLPVPLPRPFVRVLAFQLDRTSKGNPVHFAGHTSRSGWYRVMPVAILIKTPIPVLLLFAFAAWQALRRRPPLEGEWMALAAVAVCVGLFTLLKSVSVGLRYVLPAYPFVHLLVGGLLRKGTRPGPAAGALLALLLAWTAWGTLRVHPHYLAYFNESVGGPANGHRWLVDSFLDWGQDLPGLKRYMDAQGIGRIRLAYFGSADARHHGIAYDYLPSVGLAPQEPGDRWWYEVDEGSLAPLELDGGPIAVSATLWAGVFYGDYYAPLRDLEPVACVGHSILIFDPRAPAPPP